MDTVFRWLGWSPASLPRARRRFDRARELAMFSIVGLLTLAWAVVLVQDWIAWQIGDIGARFDSAIYLIGLIAPFGAPILLYRVSRDADLAIALRELVRRAPADLVKPVELRPMEPSALLTPGLGTRVGPFSWPGRGDWWFVGLAGWIGLIVGLFGIALGGKEAVDALATPSVPIALACDVVTIGFGQLDVCAGLALIAAGRRLRRRNLWLEATALELRGWRFDVWPTRVALPWSSARRFYGFRRTHTFRDADSTSTYILEGDDAAITWAVSSKTSAAARVASDALCRLIVASTGLPLTDASAALGIFGQVNDSTVAGWARRYGTPDPPRRIVRVMLPLALLLVVSIVGFVADNAIPSLELAYYNPLVRQVHAQTPLYQSALAQADDAWSLPAPGAGTASYTGTAYQLAAAQGASATSLLQTSYGDAAVQVTLEDWPNGAQGDAGLVVRDDPTQHQQIVFMVWGETDGAYNYWQLVRTSDDPYADMGVLLAQGSADSLHAGTNPTNQLLVIVRGTQYLCYVNGQFAGAGYDNTLHQGQPGLYVEHDAGPVSFSGFAVYPTVR